MTNPTSHFNWQMPTSTDLVTDLPADFEVFGQAVDTDFQYLLGGTTGQVLAKTSGTDLDFQWVAQDDSNAIQNAIVDAKGDLISATAADTPARLAVGANNTVLVADSAEATGMKWATPAASGKVLQVVQAQTTTAATIASTSFTDTNLTATITPSAASSKVLVFFTQQVRVARVAAEAESGYQLVRGATSVLNLGTGGYETHSLNVGGNSNQLQLRGIISGAFLDSPATTSATTYKTQLKLATTANSGTSTVNENSAPATMILMEIGA